MQGNETTNTSEGGNTRTITTYTDNASGNYQLEAIPGAESTGLLKVAQASGTMSKSVVEQHDNHYVFGGCNITVTQTRESFEQGALEKLEGAPAVVIFGGDGTYQIMIPNMSGASGGTVHTVATETSSGPNCHAADPTDTTDNVEGHLATSILTVTGQVGENPRSLVGTASVTIEGVPDHVYSVSWSLQQ